MLLFLHKKTVITTLTGIFLAIGAAFLLPWGQNNSDIKQELPAIHNHLSAISKMITAGKLEQALQESLKVEESLKKTSSTKQIHPGSIARAMNLLRIAELQHTLGRPKEEAAAWHHFEKAAGWEDSHSIAIAQQEAFYLLEKSFKEKGFDLKDYVRYRKQSLASQ